MDKDKKHVLIMLADGKTPPGGGIFYFSAKVAFEHVGVSPILSKLSGFDDHFIPVGTLHQIDRFVNLRQRKTVGDDAARIDQA